MLDAFGARLAANAWMTPETRGKAVAKLNAVTVKVGYPDTWETYEDVVPADTYAGSMRSALEATVREQFGKAGQPVDRTKWDIPAQIVNARYDPFGNEIVFPAGILQPPFFDHEADPASNYGAHRLRHRP